MSVREIKASLITEAVKRMCAEANCHLSSDVKECIKESYEREDWQGAREILDRIIKNFEIADSKCQPVCQDTGVACVFLKKGQYVLIDGDLNEAVNEGMRQGYRDGFLRKSVVKDPLNRVNTGDNTPANICVLYFSNGIIINFDKQTYDWIHFHFPF